MARILDPNEENQLMDRVGMLTMHELEDLSYAMLHWPIVKKVIRGLIRPGGKFAVYNPTEKEK